MALIFWIEAINSGGAIGHKQKAPCIFCQYYPVSGVFSMNSTPLAPLILGYLPICAATFSKNKTLRSYRTKIKHYYTRIILFLINWYHLMKTIEVKTAVAVELGHVTNLDQSVSSKITTSHVTQQGKETLTNRKLCNFVQHFSLYEVIQ